MNTDFSIGKLPYPEKGLPYFAILPYYLWGEVNYNSDGDCKTPLDKTWTYLEVYDRSNRDNYFAINVNKNKTKLIIKGNSESVKGIFDFFSKSPNEKAMKRALAVNYCFEHPALKKFATDHSFWGSWKWIGTMASEFTITGRWIMLDAMMKNTRGIFVANSWRSFAMKNNKTSQALALSMHINDLVKDETQLLDFKEPDRDEWEKELFEYYVSILKDFDCSDDVLMTQGSQICDYAKDTDCSNDADCNTSDGCDEIDLAANQWMNYYGIDLYSKGEYRVSILKDFGCSDVLMTQGSQICDYAKDTDCSNDADCDENDSYDENDLVANQWMYYGIDIYSKDSIQLFKTMGMFSILEDVNNDECTYNITKDDFAVQPSYRCSDCFPNNTDSSGVCEFCSRECIRLGHNLSKVKYSPFYCDKGHILKCNQ